MPEKIEIGWNKKMLKTAGLCSSGELQSPEKQRFAKIEISLKVCDSAGDCNGVTVLPGVVFF